MLVLASPYIKGPLICFESDSILDFTSKHHSGTVHKVIDHIFKFRLKSHRVNQVNIDLCVCCNLDSFVSFDKVDKSSDVQGFVAFPSFLQSELVGFLFEEQNLT